MPKGRNTLRKIKIGVYQLEPVSSNHAKFMEKGYVRYGKNFNDEVIKLDFLDKEKIKFEVANNRVKYNDDIYLEFYKDNVASTYFSRTTKIPIFHCAVMYSKKIIIANLLNIYLYFNVENAKSIKSFKELIDSNLKGTYELEIEFNDKKDTLPFEKFTSFEDLIYDIIELCSSEIMDTMIEEELEKRNEERIKKYGKIDDYTIPDKVIKFDDLVKQYQEKGSISEDVL